MFQRLHDQDRRQRARPGAQDGSLGSRRTVGAGRAARPAMRPGTPAPLHGGLSAVGAVDRWRSCRTTTRVIGAPAASSCSRWAPTWRVSSQSLLAASARARPRGRGRGREHQVVRDRADDQLDVVDAADRAGRTACRSRAARRSRRRTWSRPCGDHRQEGQQATPTGTSRKSAMATPIGMTTPENACRNGVSQRVAGEHPLAEPGQPLPVPLAVTCRKPWFQRVRCLSRRLSVPGVSSLVTMSES